MLGWFVSLFRDSGPPVRRPPRCRLSLETLEGRDVPDAKADAASQVELKDAKDEAEFGRRLAEFDQKLSRDRWLLGGNWDHDRAFGGARHAKDLARRTNDWLYRMTTCKQNRVRHHALLPHTHAPSSKRALLIQSRMARQ